MQQNSAHDGACERMATHGQGEDVAAKHGYPGLRSGQGVQHRIAWVNGDDATPQSGAESGVSSRAAANVHDDPSGKSRNEVPDFGI
jgi:hypothetical protein